MKLLKLSLLLLVTAASSHSANAAVIKAKEVHESNAIEAWITHETRTFFRLQSSGGRGLGEWEPYEKDVTVMYAKINPGCAESKDFAQIKKVIETDNEVSIRMRLVDMLGVDIPCDGLAPVRVGEIAVVTEDSNKKYNYWFQGQPLVLGQKPAGNVWTFGGKHFPLKDYGPKPWAAKEISVSASQRDDVLTTKVSVKRAAPENGLFALLNINAGSDLADYRLMVYSVENTDAVTDQGTDLVIESKGMGPRKSVIVNGFSVPITN